MNVRHHVVTRSARKNCLCAAFLALATGCSSMPGLDEPSITIEPRYLLLEVGGETSMQSRPTPSTVQDNPSIDLQEFGVGSRDEDFGGTISLGDGFSGFDLSYLGLDQKTSQKGMVPADWGNIRAGDTVGAKVRMDEIRLRYIAQLIETETDHEVRLTAGAGGMLVYRDLRIDVLEETETNAQDLDIDDAGSLYLCVRARVAYQMFGIELDYGISPELQFGGDYDGILHDAEVLGTFTFEDQDLTFYAGYRREEFEAEGVQDGLAYTADLEIDGWVFGLRFQF